MKRLLYGGDWNARPGDPDRYRPRWIARHGRRRRLSVSSAGPGAFGDIDYVMSDAPVSRIIRLGRHGSDHDLVMFIVHGPGGKQLRGATWNLGEDRVPWELAQTLAAVMRRYKLDFILLQEAVGYIAAIRRLRTHKLIAFTAVPGESQNPILVRHDLEHTSGHTRRLSTNGWPLANGNLHAPLYATVAVLDGWLGVWSLHLPNFERGPAHAKAYRQAARRLRRRARRHLKSTRRRTGPWA